jgi:hypothetical protein
MSFCSDQAARYGQMADDIQHRLETEGSSINDADFGALQQQGEELTELSEDSNLDDLQQTLDGMAIDQTKLAECTERLQAAIKKVARIDMAIGLASAALGLGTAIASGNLSGIASALEQAEKVLTQKPVPAAGLAMAASGEDAEQAGDPESNTSE